MCYVADICNRKAVFVSGAKRILMCFLHTVHKLAVAQESRVRLCGCYKLWKSRMYFHWVYYCDLQIKFHFSPPLVQCYPDFKSHSYPQYFILGKWPTWRTIPFYIFISILYMFRATPCSSSAESIVLIQPLVYVILCRWPYRVLVGNFLSDLHTVRSPTQRLYWYNWFSWWWALGCSKRVEKWNKHTKKVRQVGY